MLRPIFIDGKAARQIPYSRLTKTPIIKGWPDLASSDPKQLALWSSLYPRAVPGVLCDLWTVLDVDNLDWLREHEQRLPLTYNYRTARGRHFYFQRVPQLRSSVGRIAPNVDVKSGRAGVLYWPHINGLRPVEAPAARLPDWLLAILAGDAPRSLHHEVDGRSYSRDLPLRGDGPLVVEERERRLPKPLYFKLVRLMPVGGNVTGHDQRRARGALCKLIEKRDGRNDAINCAAHNVFRQLIDAGNITYAAAESLLFDAAMLNGYVAKDGEAAALKTIRSGLGNTGGPPPPDDDDLVQGGAA